jgi:hypothetical protein
MANEELITQLNAETKEERLIAARALRTLMDNKDIAVPEKAGYTNNHVHTTFSFSPYSPTKAVWMAVMSGLSTVGIIDHDAVGGAEEFIEAGEILGIPTTVGFEIRTDWSHTPLAGRRVNNPDQLGSAYICAHGLAHTQIAKADAYLKKVREAREQRNRAMTHRLSAILEPFDIVVDYDADVLPLSCAAFGGEVTERHILFALTNKMVSRFGKGEAMIDFISGPLGIKLSGSQRELLADSTSDIYAYDVLNILKGSFVARIYIDSSLEEMPDVREVVALIRECGAIPSYCYLGDVGASPTGDKKAQKFEDDYLEEVLSACLDIGFDAIAYMPSRNTAEQLERVIALCDNYGFMQISGEDINQPRQSFICKQLKDPKYVHLIDATWALVGHEKAVTQDLKRGMFADGIKPDPHKMRALIEHYKQIGLGEAK